MFFLSYIIDSNTKTYGNRNVVDIKMVSDISKGDVANDTTITTTVHVGTHIDMPYHFYQDGQTIEDFDDNFWLFKKPLFVEIEPKSLIIKDELICVLDNIQDIGYDILVVKTGICNIRDEDKYWNENYGFAPEIYDYLIDRFKSVRVFGFDSISVSSFQNRMVGREAHKRFLNPAKPILLLEDMDLRYVSQNTKINKLIVSPLRIAKCDGLPCSVIGLEND